MGGQGKAQGWRESLGRKVPWTVITDQLAGGLWRGRFLHTAPWTHFLSVSDYDKWQRVKVAGWQLPPLRKEQIFLALCLGALALG